MIAQFSEIPLLANSTSFIRLSLFFQLGTLRLGNPLTWWSISFIFCHLEKQQRVKGFIVNMNCYHYINCPPHRFKFPDLLLLSARLSSSRRHSGRRVIVVVFIGIVVERDVYGKRCELVIREISDGFCAFGHNFERSQSWDRFRCCPVSWSEMFRRNPTRIEMTIKDIEEFDELKKKVESARKDSKEQTSRDSIRPGTSVRDICEAVGLRKRGAI